MKPLDYLVLCLRALRLITVPRSVCVRAWLSLRPSLKSSRILCTTTP